MTEEVKKLLDATRKDIRKAKKIASRMLNEDKFTISAELFKMSDNWKLHYSVYQNLFSNCDDREIAIVLVSAFAAAPPQCSKPLLSFLESERDKMLNRILKQRLTQ